MPAPFLDASLRHPLINIHGEPHTQTVQLARAIDHPNITVGDFTYYNDFEPVADYAARIAPYLYPGAPEHLHIGKFCQIAHGVRFLAAGNHPMDGFSTYPFSMFDHDLMEHYPALVAPRPDTLIGHDVWLGQGAMVLPGVSIGNGAVIGAGAVVARDVAPWSIVAGNPGQELRRRFDAPVQALLDRLAWWDLPLEEIRALVPVLASGDRAGLERAMRRLRS
ncbi:CatB-related O-acetyltransferase [Maritimibacter sp. HL-12]|uniref:CatB-related O-acetyltransferase n=1 Tax=Maritimibacter sp. HL-12 TaxID=1162418 RepID=UPI000A0F3CB6|nr:CatB-related O-acetyltransferase [Maritimibacter sp. HL-12]SMH48469.1 virginiamycin A acetyltransferase [Maritimibacter sp. HL-12]